MFVHRRDLGQSFVSRFRFCERQGLGKQCQISSLHSNTKEPLFSHTGLVADRFPKRKIIILTQSTFGVLALILGILVISGRIEIWMVYIFALLFGLVNVFDNTTRQTFVVEMVSESELPNAIALNTAEINMARVFGPAIAGVLIASIGIGFCFIFNAISFVAVIIALVMMRKDELHKVPMVEKKKGQLIEGFKYVKSNPLILNTLIMMAIVGTLTYEFSVSLALMAQFVFHGDAKTYAFLTSAMGAGSVIGGLLVAGEARRHHANLAPLALIFGLFVFMTAIAPTLYFAIFSLVAVGFISVYFTSLGNVTLQLESDPTMRGRVMALWTIAFLGSTPIGGPIVGWVGENFGARSSLVLGAVAALVASWIGYKNLRKKDYQIK